ncbi:MAG: 4Fe-4S dicluster domain-containing protein [Smithella sp.]
MKRQIIKIDNKCNGCGLCVTNCDEQAIEIFEGKARLIDETMCDGLGICIDSCPEKALLLEERETEPFDERKSLEKLVQKESLYMEDYLFKLSAGGNSDIHKEYGNLLKRLKDEPIRQEPAGWENKIPLTGNASTVITQNSEFPNWPVQLHLINTAADLFKGQDVILAGDCVAYALADFHSRFLKGKKFAIACARLDRDSELYVNELRLMVDEAKINTLTAVIMEVPCCRGLLRIAEEAVQKAGRKVPLKAIIISTSGEVLSEEWV